MNNNTNESIDVCTTSLIDPRRYDLLYFLRTGGFLIEYNQKYILLNII